MADFIPVAGWTQHNHPHPTPQRSLQHLRSFSTTSSIKNTPHPPRPLSNSSSSSALHTSTVSNAPGSSTPRSFSYEFEDGNMSTLPDPRSRTMSLANENSPTSPTHHPDLNNEVAALSTKLINAINYQTNLDDSLAQARHALETTQERVKQLERENQEHADLVTRGMLIQRSTADAEKNELISSLAEARKLRADVEKEKKGIEQELENLTAALFEEANKMVITARESAQKEHELVTRKNDQLKAQLADTEILLKSHQEQLAELKQVMEQMTEERDDQTIQTEPSTPGLSKSDKDELRDSSALHSASIPEPVSPSYPTSFTHLLHTVLRTDLAAYDDFTALLKMSKNVVGSRVSSGSYGSIGLGLGLGAYSSSQIIPANGSTSSIATGGTGSSPATPTTPASSISAKSSTEPNSLTPLNKTDFYKRALAEDIEPTLRLDTAPGLSWLARRNVQNAICDGTLVVDPMPITTRPYSFPCSLCGETRKDATHTRSHRFRTSENDSAQKYPLCKYCLGRVRSTCDFLGFLRILKDGHWRADDAESEKAAWEESVRLREQMFWARMGGGVVPILHHADAFSKSPRISQDERKEEESKLSDELERAGEFKPRDITPQANAPKEPSKADTVAAEEVAAAPSPVVSESDIKSPTEISVSEVSLKEEPSNRISTQSTASLRVASPGEENDEVKRLSITIPSVS